MPLDVTLTMTQPVEVFSANITHNLNRMAAALGVYQEIWKSDTVGINFAHQLIPVLESTIQKMKYNPEFYQAFDSPNGYGKYSDLLAWLEEYLDACKQYPEAVITVNR